MLLKINIGAFILGDNNSTQCFSCGNRIHWNEGQDPLDEAFHNNCEYLPEVTNDTQVIYIISNHKLKKLRIFSTLKAHVLYMGEVIMVMFIGINQIV